MINKLLSCALFQKPVLQTTLKDVQPPMLCTDSLKFIEALSDSGSQVRGPAARAMFVFADSYTSALSMGQVNTTF